MNASEIIDPQPKAKKIPDGYHEGRWTWAIVQETPYGDEVIESGFSTKRSALEWLSRAK